MQVKSALKPDLFFDFRQIGTLKDSKDPEVQEENWLQALSNHNGWKVLKEYIQELQKNMDGLLKQAMEQGLSREEIGERTILVTLCKEQLQNIIERVEDVREDREIQPVEGDSE